MSGKCSPTAGPRWLKSIPKSVTVVMHPPYCAVVDCRIRATDIMQPISSHHSNYIRDRLTSCLNGKVAGRTGAANLSGAQQSPLLISRAGPGLAATEKPGPSCPPWFDCLEAVSCISHLKSSGCILAVTGMSKSVMTPPERVTDLSPELANSDQRTALLRKYSGLPLSQNRLLQRTDMTCFCTSVKKLVELG